MTSKLTREELLNIIETDHVQCGEASALARMALAAMDSEPVAWTWHHLKQWHVTNDEERARDLARDGVKVDPLYRHAQPAPERDRVRSEHAEWSQATFGDVGPVGPLKHLSKEALEAAAEPDDLSEWADMQFLLWDAQRRAGITDDQIIHAMIEKLAINKQREWPEPKDGEPRLHIKEQPAPVVPEKATVGEMPFLGASEGVYVRGWNDCRAAMLQENAKSAGESNNCRRSEKVQDLLAGNCRENGNSSTNNFRENAETSTNRSREHFISLCNEFWNWSEMDMICADDKGYELRLEWNGQSFTHPVTRGLWRMYQAAHAGIPIISDGYVMVPKEPTEAMMLHNSGCQHHAWDDPDCAMRQTRRLIWSHMLAAAPQEVKGE
ncbi:DUF550 domain-containing protein [Raoultella ornithinolytica]|uniref:DUF550 domain-containing protein n=1 Tax=Raoultella ornithinolytica TaxID=54291 RepID=UPI00387317A9